MRRRPALGSIANPSRYLLPSTVCLGRLAGCPTWAAGQHGIASGTLRFRAVRRWALADGWRLVSAGLGPLNQTRDQLAPPKPRPARARAGGAGRNISF